MNKLTLLKLESNHKEYPHTALLIISLEIFRTKIFLLHTDPQVVYCNCVKFHQYPFRSCTYKKYWQSARQKDRL